MISVVVQYLTIQIYFMKIKIILLENVLYLSALSVNKKTSNRIYKGQDCHHLSDFKLIFGD